MRSQTVFTHTLAPLLTNYFFLKKIYPLYSQYRVQLFVSFWNYNSHNLDWLRSGFLSKTKSKPRLKQKTKLTINTFQHPFFLTSSSQFPPKKRPYLPIMLRNSDHLNPTLGRSNLKQLKRTELLCKWLSIKSNLNPSTSQFKVTFSSLSRHKLFHPFPGLRFSLKNQISEPVKIFETFNSLQKFYNRRYRKYNFIRNFKKLGKSINVSSSMKLTINTNLTTRMGLLSIQPQFRNIGKPRYSRKLTKKNLFIRTQHKLYYNPSIQKISPKIPILPLFSTLSHTPMSFRADKIRLKPQSTITSTKPLFTLFPNIPTLVKNSGYSREASQTPNRFKVGPNLNTVFLTPLNPTLKELGTTERVRLLEQNFSFATTLTAKKYLSLLVSQTKILTSRGLWENLFNPSVGKTFQSYKTSGFLGKPSKLFNWSTSYASSLYSITRLTHVRFKPGYSRQWRMFRAEFKDTFSLPNRYQYRLTRYITTVSINQRKQHFFTQALMLKQGLVESKLVSDVTTANSFISSGLVFLNGQLINNPNLRLVINDLIQLTVSLKYYSVLKWQLASTLKNKNLLAKMLWKRGKNWRRNNFTFPKWVLNFSSTFLDTPLYLEVDHFSLSFYVINHPTTNLTSKYPKVLPSYNWKYIV